MFLRNLVKKMIKTLTTRCFGEEVKSFDKKMNAGIGKNFHTEVKLYISEKWTLNYEAKIKPFKKVERLFLCFC